MQSHREWVALTRNCQAVEVPSGMPVELLAGTEVMIMQSLGGTFTVVSHQGAMASIQGKDADALGKAVPSELQAAAAMAEKPVEEQVWAKLRTCYDPEIPHNIVDLGLVYECKLEPFEDDFTKVLIKMTLTAPGCGMGEWLKQDVKNKILDVTTVKICDVQLVFDPPWDKSKMHPALRREFM